MDVMFATHTHSWIRSQNRDSSLFGTRYSSQPNLDWRQQAKALIEPVNSMGVFGKLLHNRILREVNSNVERWLETMWTRSRFYVQVDRVS